MSVPSFSAQGSLFSVAAITGSLFPADDRYRLFAQKIYPCLVRSRHLLEKTYKAGSGRSAIEPVLLLGVCLLQFLDGVPDRQALECLRYHAGWNFALNRQLGDAGFHPSTLCRFRDRLEEHGLSGICFQAVLDGLVEAGLVRRNARQRLDSTHVLGQVRQMSRVDGVRQTLRLALENLDEVVPKDQRPEAWSNWWSLYVESRLDYRAGAESLGRKMKECGADAQRLLEWITSHPEWDSREPIQLLRRVFAEQFLVEDETLRPRGKGELDSGRVQNPLDPDATYAIKMRNGESKAHVGYKAQVAETVVERVLEATEPTANFVTGVVIQPAHHSDDAGLEAMEPVQASLGMEAPPTLYVDGAYVSAARLVEMETKGRELMGPAQGPPRRNPDQLGSDEFEVDVEARRAVCPAGRENDQCSRLEGEKAVQYRFEWNLASCATCQLRTRCLGSNARSRTLVVGEFHTALQKRRKEQQTEDFLRRMHHRNAIEGTQSELVRAHGLRRARYRGLGRVQLQGWFAGAACNAKRWLRRVAWELSKATTPATLETIG
jgi:transposase